jgi:ethanolamine permease
MLTDEFETLMQGYYNSCRQFPPQPRPGFHDPVVSPIPALVLLALCSVTYFAVFLGYGTQLIAMVSFYIVVSLWFHFWRYRFVKRADQFTMPWPKPRGY